MPTSKGKHRAWIAACDACQACTRKWCFSERRDDNGCPWVDVEELGQCEGARNPKRRKLDLARHYGGTLGLSYAKAVKALTDAGVPEEEWPSEQQVKDQRKHGTRATKHYSSVCLGALEHFLQFPPDHLRVFQDRCVCEQDCVRLAFAATDALAWFEECELTSFLLDFTFKTNTEGLLLGGAGPVGLYVGKDGLPHMRFVPVVFLLSDAEDEEAHTLALDLLFSLRPANAPPFTDCFADCSCFHSAEKYCGERVYLHRCLEHTKKVVKGEAAKKDDDGLPRLKRMELRAVIREWLMFAAWLPSDIEFHCFWDSILDRMRNSRCSTDFDEPKMAAYLEQHILDGSGDLWRAPWACGLGCVPLGFTTYAPNAIETTWRVLKGLLAEGYQYRGCGALMEDVALSLQSRIRAGAYSGLLNEITELLPVLVQWPGRKAGARGDGQTDDALLEGPGGQQARLDVNALLDHYRAHGQEQLFVVAECDVVLPTGQRAVCCYTLPKYKLHFATDRRADMVCAQQLALASTAGDVRSAAAHRTARVYDIARHMYLRQSFVSVFITEDGRAVDQHRHFVEGGGQSEHSVFVSGFADGAAFRLDPLALGPKNSRPRQPKHEPRGTRSAALKRMLGPPEHDAPAGAADGAAEASRAAASAEDEAAAGGAGSLEAAPSTPDAPDARPPAQHRAAAPPVTNATKCVARRWAGGELLQCTYKRIHGEFCGVHRLRQPHGRVDEPMPNRPEAPIADVATANAAAEAPTADVAADTAAGQSPERVKPKRAPVGHPLFVGVSTVPVVAQIGKAVIMSRDYRVGTPCMQILHDLADHIQVPIASFAVVELDKHVPFLGRSVISQPLRLGVSIVNRGG